jgi:hypothetical protein
VAFDFPNSPVVGQHFTPVAGVNYTYNGYGWDLAGAAASPSGWVLLNTLTASNSATLDDTTSITATYDEYQFELINILPASAATWLKMLFQVGGTFQTTNYLSAIEGSVAAGNSFFNATSSGGVEGNTTGIGLSGSGAIFWAPDTIAGEGVCGSIKLLSPNNTVSYKHVFGQTCWLGNNGANLQVGTIGGVYKATGAVTGVRFLFNAGNITSGKILVYGRKTV